MLKSEFCSTCNISDLVLDAGDYSNWFVTSLEGDQKVPLMPPIEGDKEEVKEGKVLEMLI